MIALTKADLEELGTIFLLTNTPVSLFHALERSAPVVRMRAESSPDALNQYFQKVSTKGRRSLIVVALAYATLVAALTHPDSRSHPSAAARLRWGDLLVEHALKSLMSYNRIVVDASSKPSVSLATESLSPRIIN